MPAAVIPVHTCAGLGAPARVAMRMRSAIERAIRNAQVERCKVLNHPRRRLPNTLALTGLLINSCLSSLAMFLRERDGIASLANPAAPHTVRQALRLPCVESEAARMATMICPSRLRATDVDMTMPRLHSMWAICLATIVAFPEGLHDIMLTCPCVLLAIAATARLTTAVSHDGAPRGKTLAKAYGWARANMSCELKPGTG